MRTALKKAISLALCAVLSVSALSAFTAVSAEDTEPVEIHNIVELNSIINDMSGNYLLANNIIADESVAFKSIGTSANPFKGTFDGNGYTIKNLKLTYTESTDSAYIGLFAYNNGIIKNLNLENVTAEIASYRYLNAGAFAGQNVINRKNCATGGKILNCYATGNFQNLSASVYTRIGGITGNFSNGTINNCVSDIDISYNGTSSVDIGGISSSNGGIIYNCGNSGDITVLTKASASIGGIAGVINGTPTSPSTIQDCFNTGSINAESDESLIVGGIAGKLETNSSSNIIYTCNSGKITAKGNFSSGFNPDYATMAYGAIAGIYGSKGSNNYYVEGTYSKGVGKATTGNELVPEAKTVEEIRTVEWDSEIWYCPTDTAKIPQISAFKNIESLSLSNTKTQDESLFNNDLNFAVIAKYDDGTSETVKSAVSVNNYLGSRQVTFSCKNVSDSYIFGDVNDDKLISVSDLVRMRGSILTENKLTGLAFYSADVNIDNSVTVTDIVSTLDIMYS